MTWSYSRSTCAAATHSGRPCSAPSAASRSASMPCSTARMSRSRSSARNPRLSSATRTCSGHGGGVASPFACPVRSSRRMTSCSGPLISRGGSSPRSAASRRRIPKPNAWWVRASGSVEVRASRAVTLWRSRAAATRVEVSSRHSSGDRPPNRTRSTTSSTAVVVLPVPGAPRTRSSGPPASSAACCPSSRLGASTTSAGARRSRTTSSSHHGRATRPVQLAGPSQRARARSTRSPSNVPRIIGVLSSR